MHAIILDASSSSDNVGMVNYTWNFTYDGDNITLYGKLVGHQFDNPGTYIITLTVTDTAGNQDNDTMTVTVTSPIEMDNIKKEGVKTKSRQPEVCFFASTPLNFI